MLSIKAVLGFQEFRLHIRLRAQGGSPISTGIEDFAVGSAVLLTVSYGLGIELCDLEAENAMLKGDYSWQVVEIVI